MLNEGGRALQIRGRPDGISHHVIATWLSADRGSGQKDPISSFSEIASVKQSNMSSKGAAINVLLNVPLCLFCGDFEQLCVKFFFICACVTVLHCPLLPKLRTPGRTAMDYVIPGRCTKWFGLCGSIFMTLRARVFRKNCIFEN